MAQFRQVSTGVLLAWVLAALPAGAASPRGQSLDKPPPVLEHKVTRGETLWSISQKHHTSVGAVMDYNHLPDHNVREGMVLRIPPKVAVTVPAPRHRKHTVKRGEDFWDVADRYDIKPSALAKANPNVNPSRIHSGMELIIPVQEEGDKGTRKEPVAPRQQSNASTNMVQHTIGENETFYSIARRYGVGMDAVVAANPDVRPERLRSGMKVWVPTKKSAPAPAAATAALAQQKPATTLGSTGSKSARSHVVKENESIASIAKKYGVSESALLRENKLSEDDAIYVDDSLKIPTAASASPPASQTKLTATTPKPPTPAVAPSPQPKPVAGSTGSNIVGNDGAIRSYIVSAGEDENTICDAFGISKKVLFEYNHLSSATKLKPGDEIAIPRVSKARKR